MMWSYTVPDRRSIEVLTGAGYPVFESIPNCVSALARMVEWQATRERTSAVSPLPEIAPDARQTVASGLAKAGRALTEAESKPLLAAYGIYNAGTETLATSRDEAVASANAIAGPVALKVQSADILHKTEAGALALNLGTPEAVGAAYDRILASAKAYKPDAKIQGVLVQPMARKGREVILGINRDPHFGPMLMLGLGGIHVEVLKDVAFAPVPVSPAEATALIGRLKGAKLLDAVRGQPPADKAALANLIVRLSQLAADHRDAIAEIDLNPVIVHDEGQGATIADALVVKAAD
jgi:acetyltransferase